MKYIPNPEYAEASFEIMDTSTDMEHEGPRYHLRFRDADVAEARKLWKRRDYLALQELAIRPLIAVSMIASDEALKTLVSEPPPN